MSNPRCQASIDLETLGTSPNSKILSVGVVAVCAETGETLKFYSGCSIDSQEDRTASASTLKWWEDQSAEARQALDYAKSPECPTLRDALTALTGWIGKLGETHTVYPWGNGSDFDVAMLNHAFDSNGMARPWGFRNVRDMRTLYDITLRFGMDIKGNAPKVGTAHNALDDAQFQANVIMESLRQIDLAAEFLRGPAADQWQAFLAIKEGSQ